MSKLIIIAGPQSSGKTTAFNFLKNYLGKKIVFLPEINPFTIKGKNHLGAAFTSRPLGD